MLSFTLVLCKSTSQITTVPLYSVVVLEWIPQLSMCACIPVIAQLVT